jgi:alpha-beta hydrolase superfamily lysophospholipase
MGMSSAVVVVVALLHAWRGFLLFPAEEKAVDSGTFSITVGGRRAGSETFQIVQVGRSLEIRTKTTVALPQGATAIKGTLQTDLDWRPWTGSFESTFRRQTTRITLQRLGASLEQVTKYSARSVAFTRPPRQPDLYFGPNVLAHLTPLCREVDPKGKTLTAFPAAPLKLAPPSVHSYAMTKLGAPAVELTDIVADLASSMRIEVLCDGTKLVAARQYNQRLTAVRASYEELASTLEGRTRDKPLLSPTLVEVPRKVRSAGATLGCTLLLPATHAAMQRPAKHPAKPASPAPAAAAPGALSFEPEPPQPLPGVVLLGDFGTQDRDGNSAGPGDFHLYFNAVLAAKLGEAGIVSLRCDDRGAGASPGDAKRVTLQSLLADATAALAALRAEPAVDPARAALVGHSEGALVATMLAPRDRKLRALALLAPPARPLDAIIVDQEQASMRRFGRSDGEITESVAELKATYDAVRTGKRLPPSLSPAERKGMQDSLAWLRSHFRHAPFVEATQLSALPVLVAQGGKDVEVTVKDAELARDAFEKAGNKLVAYKLYPDLNHLFAVSRSGSVADYYDPLAEVDGAFLRDTVGFLSKSLAAPRKDAAPQSQATRVAPTSH